MPENSSSFDFHWRYKDFEIHSAKNIIGAQPYLELIKWDTDADKPYCYTLAIYQWDDEGGELHFVGNRPFRAIAEIDLSPIWKQLWLACEMLQDWYQREKS